MRELLPVIDKALAADVLDCLDQLASCSVAGDKGSQCLGKDLGRVLAKRAPVPYTVPLSKLGELDSDLASTFGSAIGSSPR